MKDKIIHISDERRITIKKLICVLLIFMFLINIFVTEQGLMSQVAAEGNTGTVNATTLNVREGPGTTYKILTNSGGNVALPNGTVVEILGTEAGSDSANPTWYKVSFTYKGATLSGFVSTAYVTVNQGGSGANDNDFEAYLSNQGFPESYKPYLRQLHAAHPNWVFKAVNTGLDWNTVIENERCKSGQVKNLIVCTASNPQYNYRSTDTGYNWTTDTWSVFDGSSWYAASTDIVKYYMDPRNFLSEQAVFQFETLSYDGSVQTESGVQAILNGGFMGTDTTTYNGTAYTYAQVFIKAAEQSGVSPYHLASRSRQEVGNTYNPGNYTSTSGTNSKYPGIYNFYNIGAYDGANAAEKGLYWAAQTDSTYLRPWTCQYLSIVGGAKYIGNNYITKGQNTIYFEKFNVVNTAWLYGHQYMSNVQGANSEASTVYKAYNSYGLLDSGITFSIPVYSNMPESACTMPANSGNPNNWLKTLNIQGYTLTPSFGVNSTNDYSLIVPEATSSITISASTVNSNAKINGAGTVNLSIGNNIIPITVTAQNGNTRTYNLTVVRQGTATPTTPTDTNISFNGSYKIDTYITGVQVGTNASTFISNLGASQNASVSVLKANGTTQTGTVGTGNIVNVTAGGITKSYTIVIYGDVSGDGQINVLDLLKVQKHIVGSSQLSGAYAAAGNVKKSSNGAISVLDLLKIQKDIINSKKIEQ